MEEKNKMQEQNENIIFKFARENYGWIAAVTTLLGVIFSAAFKFIDYFQYSTYCLYYGLDIQYYHFNDKSFILEIGWSLLLMWAMYSLLYCFKHLKEGRRAKKYKTITSDIIIILCTNLLITLIVSIAANLNIWVSIIVFIVLIFTEWIISKLLFWNLKKDDEKIQESSYDEIKDDMKNSFKIFPFIILIYMIMVLVLNFYTYITDDEYRIVYEQEETKVIMHSEEDYYITLKCEIIDDEKIIIYKGTQEKISNTEIATYIITFDKVELKEKYD